MSENADLAGLADCRESFDVAFLKAPPCRVRGFRKAIEVAFRAAVIFDDTIVLGRSDQKGPLLEVTCREFPCRVQMVQLVRKP